MTLDTVTANTKIALSLASAASREERRRFILSCATGRKLVDSLFQRFVGSRVRRNPCITSACGTASPTTSR